MEIKCLSTVTLLSSSIIFLSLFCMSCETLKDSSKYQLIDGFYKTRINDRLTKVYVLAGSDSIKIYRKEDMGSKRIDTIKSTLIFFSPQKPNHFKDYSFHRNTFDVDVLTVLFKYRPPVKEFPPQFNATFNGAAYFGYRTDVYKLMYNETPLHIYKRRITHYGYSFGFFTGLGSARIDEFVTRNALSIEYDGLVNLSGFAAIIAIDKLTAGLTLGADHLLDKNSHVWVNNGKLWIGLSLGLNLN
jgi:hypothetical protein